MLDVRGMPVSIEDEDVLLVPSDKKSDKLEYEDGDGEIVETKSSYKYLAGGKLVVKAQDLRSHSFTFNAGPFGGFDSTEILDKGDKPNAKERTVLLYEARKNAHGGRFVLFTDGTIAHLTEDDFKMLIAQKL